MAENNPKKLVRQKPTRDELIKRQKVRFAQSDIKQPNIIRRFIGRFFRTVFHPISLFLYFVTILAIGGALTYFWFEFSDRIDKGIKGEVFTRSAGIYATPKMLKVGEPFSQTDLISYLKTANYVDKKQQADASRGRYAIDGNSLTVEPGNDSMIDGAKLYKPLQVKFTKDNNAVAAISDLSVNGDVKAAQLEPKLLSALRGDENEQRKAVSFQDLPPLLVKAITTTEDRSFFEHYGVNFRGIARALFRRFDTEDSSPLANQGGSSITQQLVKNLLLSDEKSLERKAKEAYMSIILETRLSKEQIFTLYANQIYLGQQTTGFSINGVGEAANSYFNKDVTALSLAESAFIAGIIRSPNRYNPYKHLEKATERRNQVLDSMFEVGAISQKDFDEAKSADVKLVQPTTRPELLDLPYFTDYAQDQLNSIVTDPEAIQHLRVYTTIDLDLQRAAYNAVTKQLDRLEKYFPKKPKGNLQAALVAIRPKTGEIVAMIGGRDYLENQFNRATKAERQPGSVFKPFVYSAAINTAYDPSPRVYTTASIFKDEKKTFTFNQETYEPNNYGDFFSNKDMTLRDALVKSKNVITVDLGMELNIGKVMNLAAKAGFPKVAKAYPSMALGTAEATPLQVATAYTTFANLGSRVLPQAVSRVTNGAGTTVAVPKSDKAEVLRPEVTYIMDDMMKDVVNRGTAVDLQKWGFHNVAGKLAYAGKTGTSRDGWFAGFTPNLVCVVYVGFDDGSDLGMKGADSALPIWADFMRHALDQHPDWNGDWQIPNGIRKAEIDTQTGKVLREITEDQDKQIQVLKNGANANNANTSNPIDTPTPDEIAKIPEPNIPPEFRRIELFINGTVPTKLIDVPDDPLSPDQLEKQTLEKVIPKPEKTPLVDDSALDDPSKPGKIINKGSITLMICPTTGYIAAPSCVGMKPKTFKVGEDPKLYCSPEFHKNAKPPANKVLEKGIP